MICPYCSANYNKVLNSRDTRKETQIWRRRQCIACKEVFTTYEKVDLSYLNVRKRSGKVERFKESKLYASIFQSCIYGKNVDKGEMALLSDEILKIVTFELVSLKMKEVETEVIRDTVLRTLYERSPETFLRYLAYVKELSSPRVLKRELKEFFS